MHRPSRRAAGVQAGCPLHPPPRLTWGQDTEKRPTFGAPVGRLWRTCLCLPGGHPGPSLSRLPITCRLTSCPAAETGCHVLSKQRLSRPPKRWLSRGRGEGVRVRGALPCVSVWGSGPWSLQGRWPRSGPGRPTRPQTQPGRASPVPATLALSPGPEGSCPAWCPVLFTTVSGCVRSPHGAWRTVGTQAGGGESGVVGGAVWVGGLSCTCAMTVTRGPLGPPSTGAVGAVLTPPPRPPWGRTCLSFQGTEALLDCASLWASLTSSRPQAVLSTPLNFARPGPSTPTSIRPASSDTLCGQGRAASWGGGRCRPLLVTASQAPPWATGQGTPAPSPCEGSEGASVLFVKS